MHTHAHTHIGDDSDKCSVSCLPMESNYIRNFIGFLYCYLEIEGGFKRVTTLMATSVFRQKKGYLIHGVHYIKLIIYTKIRVYVK
jgi:hypothetical protein